MKNFSALLLVVLMSCNNEHSTSKDEKYSESPQIEANSDQNEANLEQIEYINPTGTYVYNIKLDRDAEIVGEAFGDIQVASLSKNEIVLNFYYSIGAPSYNSGSFIDTLRYENNKCYYQTEEDSSCKILFEFDKNGVSVNEKATDYNFACGFGHGVQVNGVFVKKSSKEPILINPLTGDKY